MRVCEKCKHPEDNHPFRHPFIAMGSFAPKDALLTDRLASLEAEMRKLVDAVAPVRDWYEGEDAGARPMPEILSEIVEDLQDDRRVLIETEGKYRTLESENAKLRDLLRKVTELRDCMMTSELEYKANALCEEARALLGEKED